jgi:hypothetical protein
MFQRRISYFIFVSVCVFLLAGKLVAEDVIKYGVAFPVEDTKKIDAGTSKVRVLGNELIVANQSLDMFVVKQYLRPSSIHHLALGDVFRFIRTAVEEGDIPIGVEAFAAVIHHPNFSSLELIEFLEDIPDSQARDIFFKQSLNQIGSLKNYPDALGTMVFYVSMRDLRWLKTEGVRHVYLHGEAVKRYYKSRFYRALADNELTEIETSLEALRELFGSEDAAYRDLNVIYIKLKQGIGAIERLDAEGMFALLDLTHSDQTLEKVLPPVIVQTVHRTAQRALSEEQAGKALTLLSWIELDWRTPTTHALVAESLNKLKPEEVSNIIGTRIEKFLTVLSSKDSIVRDAYTQFLERDLRSKVDRGHFGQVEPSFERLTLIRPDPSRRNDALRLYATFALFDAGYQHAARQILDGVQTRISFSQTIRLLTRGLLVDLTILMCAVGIPILLVAWLLLRRSAAAQKDEDPDFHFPVDDEYEEAEKPVDQPIFASLVGKGRDPVYLNYTKLLRRFELDSDVGLKEIKQAYRRAIKTVHPDINPNVDAKGREKFIELTNTYERILKLRRRLGFPSE